MKKRMVLLCSMAMACVMSGCAGSVPDLTEDESEVISEYAAGILLKYDKNYAGRLLDTAEMEQAEELWQIREEEKEQGEKQQEQQQAEVEADAEQEQNVADAEVVDRSQETVTASSIEEYYEIDGFTFKYAGFELVSGYPESSDDTVYFSMDATEGNMLLVVKFDAENQSGTDQTLDMIEYETRFRIAVNGQSGQNALTTMLLNDLSNYKDTVPAGASVSLVSMIEVPEGTNVESLTMTLRGKEQPVTLQLQ